MALKASPKPRRARLLSKGRKLNNKKRGRPKKAAAAAVVVAAVVAAERKNNKKGQSALDLLHAKTLSAAPPQGRLHTHTHKRTRTDTHKHTRTRPNTRPCFPM